MKNYLTIDLGGSKIKYALFNEAGVMKEKGSVKTPDTLEKFYSSLKEIKNKLEDKNFKISGIGFSLPGAVSNKTGQINGFSAVPYIHGFEIKKDFKKIFKIENIAMENDANCAALAEIWSGAAKDKNDIIFVIIGSGIGGAIVKDKKIHTGANLHGGEIGYTVVSTDNGVYKTWSQIGSIVAVTAITQEKLGLSDLSVEKFFQLVQEGNIVAKIELDNFYKILALGIYNLQYTYDPELIVLGGGISSRSEILSELDLRLEELYKKIPDGKIKSKIKVCNYHNDANLLGAFYNLTK